ncbi:MAG TPA: MFS transporter [Trebonia sp.]|nr:MFS transporter [Trebonia sp.]
MTATVNGTAAAGAVQGLWQRQIHHYPDTRHRMWYLGIVVAATIVLYYELYIAGAVSPNIIGGFGMTFRFYVYISVVGNAVGAFGSLAAGLADRWGRANLVAYGLLVTGLLTLIGIPNASGKWQFAILFCAIGLVEGVILVATPALIRDFSPQLGRASAMGFWTLGPVVGSLVVAVVSSNTVNHLGAWQDQFVICGIVGLLVGVVAVAGLKELSPQLRDQLMVSLRDRALIEARARGLDVEDSLRHPWRQMMRVDVIGSAFAISVFLLIYYTAVGFFTVYFTTLHGFSLSTANSIGNWFWAFDAGALILVGIISDKFRVRKPFMVIGAVGTIVMTIVFLNLGSGTSYSTFALVISILAVFLAITYAPWMASFTETVEKHNPALTATGLAVWGWIIRVVIAISVLILPSVVGSMTPLVTYGAQVQTLSVKYAPQLATLAAIDPKTQAALQANPASPAALTTAVGEIAKAFSVTPAAATARLTAVAAVPKSDLLYLSEHGNQVVTAAAAAPGEWKNWWWVCVGGQVVFLPFILLMAGRWSPRRARLDAEEHDRLIQTELDALT